MEAGIQVIVTIICTFAASSGFWAFIQSKNNKKNAERKMLLGLGHDRIMALGEKYLDRKWLTSDEYENLYKYLYVPYTEMGGNGTAEHMMQRVNKLPIHNSAYSFEEENKNATTK